ncbi:MAG TPA: hypothetical protein DCG75_05595 [Bacteroidales bacterium]|nr:hypothetical protein [Bacteroidales bacterium]
MPTFNEHISQAEINLNYLQETNKLNNYLDWQVTISFYTALHTINAHLAKTLNFQYSTHVKTKNAIAPESMSPAKLDEDTYTSYIALQNLSKRSRYLCHHKEASNDQAYFITEKLHARAIRHLDKILICISAKYGSKFKKINISNPYLKSGELQNFTIY